MPERIAQPRAAARTSSSPHWPWFSHSIADQAYFQIKTSKVDSTFRRSVYRGRSLRSALLAALALAAVAALAPASAGAAPTLKPCRGQDEFGCATLPVPLDRTGATPGTVALHYAVQRDGPRKLLIALSGGPGQSAVSSASSFAISLDPALRRYRLAVLDQRGTGKSGVLECPNLQRLRSLDPYTPQAVANCANRIGPRRAFYTTADTVLDIDALRQALGADKIALMGISYGTHVALQYARAFPAARRPADPGFDRRPRRARRLPARHLPQPAARAHRAVRPRRLSQRHQGPGGRRGRARAPHQRERPAARRLLRRAAASSAPRATPPPTSCPSCSSPATSTRSCRPPCRPPSAPRAAATARRSCACGASAREARRGSEDLSVGLNAATGCTDVTLPFPRSAPVADRAAAAQAALAAIPPTDYDPFDGQTVLRTSYVDDCLAWPGDAIRPPFTGPLPDVPALLLGGRLDTRTPLENARATAQELPHATIVALKGSGHDALDSDITGCTAQALARFIDDVAVGHPCLGQDNGVRPTPLPPRSLRDFRSAPGVGGTRGRAVFAVLDTLTDARLSALQALFAGLQVTGGGLRGGSFSGAGELRWAPAPARLRVRPGPARHRLALHQRGRDLGHRARQRRGERHAEGQPPGHGHRRARRPSRALPAHAAARRRRRCATAARCGRRRSRRAACRSCGSARVVRGRAELRCELLSGARRPRPAGAAGSERGRPAAQRARRRSARRARAFRERARTRGARRRTIGARAPLQRGQDRRSAAAERTQSARRAVVARPPQELAGHRAVAGVRGEGAQHVREGIGEIGAGRRAATSACRGRRSRSHRRLRRRQPPAGGCRRQRRDRGRGPSRPRPGCRRPASRRRSRGRRRRPCRGRGRRRRIR